MSFLQPAPPPFDLDEWKAKPYLERLKANCQDWAVNGFGTPGVVYLLYFVKLALFVLGAFFVISVFLQQVRGFSAIETGLVLLPATVPPDFISSLKSLVSAAGGASGETFTP